MTNTVSQLTLQLSRYRDNPNKNIKKSADNVTTGEKKYLHSSNVTFKNKMPTKQWLNMHIECYIKKQNTDNAMA